MKLNIKKKIIKRQVIKLFPVLIILFSAIFAVLLFTPNVSRPQFSPSDISFYGLPKDFTPITSHVFVDGQVGLWDASGQYYVLKHQVGQVSEFLNLTLEIHNFPYNLPEDFKPILSYYVPFPGLKGEGRIDLWNAEGDAFGIRPSNPPSLGVGFSNAKQDYLIKGMPSDFKPTSGFFGSMVNGEIILMNGSDGMSSVNQTFILNFSFGSGNFSGLLGDNYFTEAPDFPCFFVNPFYQSETNDCFRFKITLDVNEDNLVNWSDVFYIEDYFSEPYQECFDLNQDGAVDYLDALRIIIESMDWAGPYENLTDNPYYENLTFLIPEESNYDGCEDLSGVGDPSPKEFCYSIYGTKTKIAHGFMFDPTLNSYILVSDEDVSGVTGLPSGAPDTAYYDHELDKFILWYGKDAYSSSDHITFEPVTFFYSCNPLTEAPICLDESNLEYCSSEGIVSQTNCSYKCENNTCITNPILTSTCVDSDSGIGGTGAVAFGAYEFGSVSYTLNNQQITVVDSCRDNNTLIEQICNIPFGTIDIAGNITYDCPEGCQNGQCMGSQSEQCIDTDGKNYNIAGNTSYILGSRTIVKFQDICSSDQEVLEYYCSGNLVDFTIANCGQNLTCQEGACVRLNLEIPNTLIIPSICTEGSWRCEQNASFHCENNSWVEYPAGEGDCAEPITLGKGIIGAIIILLLVVLIIVTGYLIYKTVKKHNEQLAQGKDNSSPALSSPPAPKSPPPTNIATQIKPLTKPLASIKSKLHPMLDPKSPTPRVTSTSRNYSPFQYSPKTPKRKSRWPI
ncbi:MAG: dockerin type I domain-containing protein [Nanoarchaeota archaeon]|nr:dockerin type I domain-containing protein [Nanoarchaeota archaeon]